MHLSLTTCTLFRSVRINGVVPVTVGLHKQLGVRVCAAKGRKPRAMGLDWMTAIGDVTPTTEPYSPKTGKQNDRPTDVARQFPAN